MQIVRRRSRLCFAGGGLAILIWFASGQLISHYGNVSSENVIEHVVNIATGVKTVSEKFKSVVDVVTPVSTVTYSKRPAPDPEVETNRSRDVEVEQACRRLTSPYELQEASNYCGKYLDPVAAASEKPRQTSETNSREPSPPVRKWRQPMTIDDYVTCSNDCSRFRSDLGYANMSDIVTDEERDFPLAFSILTYESPEQTERLLRLIYRPHNVYCLHVDAKADVNIHRLAEILSTCLPNVIVAKPAVTVVWGKVSIVYSELLCIKTLLHFNSKWRYYVNVVGREFPLRTNRELVKILKSYNGANDVDGSRKREYYPDWFQYSWLSHEVRGVIKSPTPHGFVIAKGYTHMAATRAFVDYALNNPLAQDLLHWMSDIKVPDEHFFQTLNHNPQFNIPGSYRADPDTKNSSVRLKRWEWTFTSRDPCHGDILRWICNIGLGDLPWVVQAKQFFVNKVRLDLQPDAFNCLELWINERLRHEKLETQSDGQIQSPPPFNYRFDPQFYASQPFVSNHV